jgi:DNA-binding beta-propeller fold protein YncE
MAIAASMALTSVVRAQTTPRYEVDILWPKPFPERWVIGGIGGHCVNAKDRVLILNRQDVFDGDLHGGQLAPPLIEIDPAGNVVNAWGDPKLLDPRLHSCHFDKDGNVWVAAAPSGMIQKFTGDGQRLLLQIGIKGKLDSSDGTAKGKPLNSPAAAFFTPSSIFVDRGNGDVYVADGDVLGTNRRVAVFDASGKFLRHWVMEDMDNVHCMTIANDGKVYVCNRRGSGVRVYDKMGKLQNTIAVPWKPVTPPADGVAREVGGSAVAVDFSPDPAQRLMFVINQNNAQIEIFERASGKHLGSFGRPGAYPGQFNQVHGIAVDSKGNIYLSENRGRRIQKFKPVP